MFLQLYLFSFLCIFQELRVKASDNTVWNSLIITWGVPNQPNPWAFNHLPQTVGDAKKQNWTLLDDGCTDKSLGFLGQRYIQNSEPDALLIFDPTGFVAGIQMALSQSIFDQNGAYNPTTFPAVIKSTILGEGFYVLTAYFNENEKICGNRTEAEFNKTGILTHLWFINGTDSLTNPVYEPLSVNKELTDSGWTLGKCVPAMGLHYYMDFYKGMDCKTTFPFGLMYENNTLTGFNFFVFGNFPSKRYEYPTKASLPMFIDPVPDCFDSAFDAAGGITAMHVYFVSDPKNIKCSE